MLDELAGIGDADAVQGAVRRYQEAGATSPGVGATARRVRSSPSGSRPHTQIGSSGGQTQPRARAAR